MRKSPITVDAILAALAVLSTSAACSKADRASAEPPAAAPATTTPTVTATASAASPAVQATPPPPAATAASPAVVDAGTERGPAPNAKPKGASAACGATGCSADMRKGGK
jgi:hypothetical protein